MAQKVGIMGGTFDPIHQAHLILAQQCLTQYQLDRVLFIPTGQPPHKADRKVTKAADRYQMTKKAIMDNPFFVLSDIEINRMGDTYTDQTLAQLHKEYPDTEFYFIMGADSLFYLDSWHNPEFIFKLCFIVAANRGNKSIEEMDKQIAYLENKYHGKIYKLNTPNMEISSNYLRQLRAEGRSIRYYVPDSVLEYIETHHLYSNQANTIW